MNALLPRRRIVNVLNGPGAVAGGYAVQQGVPGDYPYDWLGPRRYATRITAIGPNGNGQGVAVPAAGAANQVEIASYRVPDGFQGVISDIVASYDGGGFVRGRGDALFTLDVNIPLTTTPPQGTPVQGFSSFSTTLGSTEIPWPLRRNEIVTEFEVIRLKATNVNLAPGDPNFFLGIILGWIWPLQPGAQY